jgi:hypothetical protein
LVDKKEDNVRLSICAAHGRGSQSPDVDIFTPLYGWGNRSMRFANPIAGLSNPDAGFGNLDARLDNPVARFGNPIMVLDNPDVGFGNPDMRLGNPEIMIVCPCEGIGKVAVAK